MTSESDPLDDVAELRERYRRLVELAPEGIIIHAAGTIIMANATAVRLVGGERDEQVVGRPISDFLNPPYLKALHDHIVSEEPGDGDRAPRSTAPVVRDRLHRLDGSAVEIEISAIPFMRQGVPAAHLVFRDISEQLDVQERLGMQERLQRVQRMEAVGAIAGGVAHELNNMLTVVLGFSESLARDPALPQSCRPDVQHIRTAAEHAATVTRELLAFSRRALRNPQLLDLDSTVTASAAVLRHLLGANRSLAVESRCGCTVRVDPSQLRQVLVNLTLNARDAMPTGGTVSIATSVRLIGECEAPGSRATPLPAGRYALIAVRDSGVGMDPATQRRIFEPFYTTKPVGEGTGLGLAAVDGIMEQSGGAVSVESAPGGGTTFTLFLPVVAAQDEAQKPAASSGRAAGAPPAGVGLTVMVVEDQPSVRAIAVRTLVAERFRVLEAPDGAAALALMDRHGAPDLIVTDLVMPVMGGDELVRCVEQRWPALGLAVLFMSGYSDEDLSRSGSLPRGARLLHKPFSPETLVRAVRELVPRGH